MEILISILMFLGLVMPNGQYSQDQINGMILRNQPAIQSVQQNPNLQPAIQANMRNSQQIIEEWPEDPDEPIL
ncbi:MAG: hypothetical protein ABSG15_07010 [FCB group bacterium]|jgi:hypothetical protein